MIPCAAARVAPGLARFVGCVLLLIAFLNEQLIAEHLTDDLLGESLGFISGLAHAFFLRNAALRGWTASGSAVQRRRRRTTQRFREEVLIRIGQGVAAVVHFIGRAFLSLGRVVSGAVHRLFGDARS